MFDIIKNFISGSNILLYVGGVAIVGSGFLYVKNLQDDVVNLSAENQTLSTANETQMITIDILVTDAKDVAERLSVLNESLQEIESDNKDLRNKLIKHDLKELAKAKPGIVEKRINIGTIGVFDEINKITAKD